jgi:hypothetical protein
MSRSETDYGPNLTNGSGAAAILAAGIGSSALGIFALSNDAFPAVNKFMTFYHPTGGLSGVSTMAIIVWLIAWFLLARRWNGRTVALAKVNLAAFLLLLVGLLLTFPPVMDFIQGK